MLKKHYRRFYFYLGKGRALGSQGFSLVELLLALFVFALLSGFAYRAVNTMTRSQVLMSEDTVAMFDLQRAFSMLERDVREAYQVNRTPKNSSSQVEKKPLTDIGRLTLLIVRSLTEQQAEFAPVIVQYYVQDNILYRTAKAQIPVANNVATLEPLALLKNIGSLSHELVGTSSYFGENTLPAGIVVEMQHEHLGILRRVIKFGILELKHNEMVVLMDTLEPIIIAPTTIGGAAPEVADAVSNEPVLLDNNDAVADGW